MEIVEVINFDYIENQKKKKNVCAYTRVSTKKDLQEMSLNMQIEYYAKMIKDNDKWNFVGVFSDFGRTGTSITHREKFNYMIELAKAGGIDIIITKSISRFARNTIDCLRILNELKIINVEVLFERENISSLDPKIDLTMTVYASIAEEEARSNSQNTLWGVNQRFKEGIVSMVTSKILGYTRNAENEIIVEKNEAKVVRKIFNMYSKGYSQRYIASELRKQGLKTKHYNLDYKFGTVQRILSNEKYTGNALLQKTKRQNIGDRRGEKNQLTNPMYYVENSHPPIISMELWEKVQNIKTQRMKKYNKTTDKRILKEKANHKSIYSHFVECGSCGTHYHYIVNNRNQKWERKLLVCSKNRDRKTCENGSIFTSTFDEMIKAHCNYIIKNKSMFLEELHGKLKSHPMIISVQDNLKKLNQDINELKNAINIQKLNDEFDLYTMEEMQERLHKKELEQINLKNELLTTYNTEAIIMRYRKSLKPFKSRIESIEEFPFKEFFSKVIINNRNDINLIIDPLNQNMKSNINIINRVEINYKIRQTNHKLISNLIMY